MSSIQCVARRALCAPALAAALALASAGAAAQEAAATGPREIPAVKVHRKTNPGDLPYKSFFQIQSFLQSLMPLGQRVVELRLRVNFASDKGPAYDEFQPKTWAVAIVGESVDQVIPVTRGGYFVLPELRQAAQENATLMFNTPTREGRIALEWKLKTDAAQQLSYADFGKAIEQVRSVQRKIPFYHRGLEEVRAIDYTGLRACFLADGGRIEVGGQLAVTRAEGKCQVLKYDAQVARDGAAGIAFIGPLSIVTLNGSGI